tara:strand:+ start:7664 stop:7936 length:273 start_codon:yes stop_codon:yes gene_type:complete
MTMKIVRTDMLAIQIANSVFTWEQPPQAVSRANAAQNKRTVKTTPAVSNSTRHVFQPVQPTRTASKGFVATMAQVEAMVAVSNELPKHAH